ncbi:unnamed protein product [Adineta steineri]|uniref:Peptidase C51 domain-containing protein n=1 Tax=Adineta steineri TaxID=433720 RepID=A0A814MUN2_9BILA|nr:unnamed protein product [Adineta steineri]
MEHNEHVLAPYNQILGTASINVPAYSNTDDGVFHIGRHYMHGIFLGVKWQCVEYARRWLLLRKSCIFKNIRFAADIWESLTYVERVTDGKHFPLKPHPNGSPTLPKIDTFLIYAISTEQPVGHIAVICDVGPNYIRIAEQNNKFHYWNGEYAREIPMIQKDGLYYLEDEDIIYGWMEIEDDNNELKPLDESVINTIHPQYRERLPIGKLERCIIPQKNDSIKSSWLNEDDKAEKYFIEHFSEDFKRANNFSNNLLYYKMNIDFMFTISEASNELHQMFLKATNHVIHNDELLKRFGIPEIFWNRIRHSWNNDQHLTMTGRLDLGFDRNQVKVLEYNADTASTLFECVVIQKKWAEAVELPSNFTSGRRLHSILVGNWKNMKITTRIHLLIDDNKDDMLTALYMQNVLKEANIESKLYIGTDQLFWKDGFIIDNDDERVQFVWKLWKWDSIIHDDHFIEQSDKEKYRNGEHPRIIDILLHDDIKVIEPLWKVITSSKALLPVLWEMYPNHPNLLRSEWNLTDELKEISFVKKLISHRPGDDDSIYQEVWPSENSNEYHPVIGSWIIRENFGGFVVREDQNLINNKNSSVVPCCIVWEEEK